MRNGDRGSRLGSPLRCFDDDRDRDDLLLLSPAAEARSVPSFSGEELRTTSTVGVPQILALAGVSGAAGQARFERSRRAPVVPVTAHGVLPVIGPNTSQQSHLSRYSNPV